MKKVIGVVVIAFLAFYLFTQPAAAADLVKDGVTMVGDGFNAVITFFNQLFS